MEADGWEEVARDDMQALASTWQKKEVGATKMHTPPTGQLFRRTTRAMVTYLRLEDLWVADRTSERRTSRSLTLPTDIMTTVEINELDGEGESVRWWLISCSLRTGACTGRLWRG